MNKVQSAVSYGIKQLEEEIGLILFDREGYRPKLTPEGEAFYQRASQLLKEAGELKGLGQSLAQGVEPELHLGVTALFPMQWMTGALKSFSKSNSATRLVLSMEVLAGVQKIFKGEVDLAVTEISQPIVGDLETIKIGRVRMIPVASSKHFLASKKRATRKEILQAIQVVVESTVTTGEKVSAGILEGATTWTVTDFISKRQLLLDGLGWGSMPEHLVKEDLKKKKLVELKVYGFKPFNIDFYLARKRARAHGPSAENLWNLLKALKC